MVEAGSQEAARTVADRLAGAVKTALG